MKVASRAMFLAALLRVTSADSQAHSTTAPDFGLEGTSGTTRWLHSLTGRVVIIVYEDRDSSQQNDALKRELARRARESNLASNVTLLPIANLDGYGWWPASHFARDAVVQIARTQNHEILIDWSGQLVRSYGFAPHVSHVMVVGRDRSVLFRSSGAMNASRRAEFFRVLEQAIATSVP